VFAIALKRADTSLLHSLIVVVCRLYLHMHLIVLALADVDFPERVRTARDEVMLGGVDGQVERGRNLPALAVRELLRRGVRVRDPVSSLDAADYVAVLVRGAGDLMCSEALIGAG
jgi:hypothetical protein